MRSRSSRFIAFIYLFISTSLDRRFLPLFCNAFILCNITIDLLHLKLILLGFCAFLIFLQLHLYGNLVTEILSHRIDHCVSLHFFSILLLLDHIVNLDCHLLTHRIQHSVLLLYFFGILLFCRLVVSCFNRLLLLLDHISYLIVHFLTHSLNHWIFWCIIFLSFVYFINLLLVIKHIIELLSHSIT